MTDLAKNIWLHAIAIVAKARNKCAPGERFEALNLVMGDLEDARRRDQLIMPDFPAVCPDCGPDCETHNGESDCAALQPGEAQGAEPVALPADTAPKDGNLLRLLVDYTGEDGWGALENAEQAWTVGFNGLKDTGDDEWQFAGWCWSHDHFTEGRGRVIGWLPFHATPPATQVTATDLERIAADFEKDSNLDRYICCNGRDCGCQGATAGEYAAYKIRALAGDGK